MNVLPNEKDVALLVSEIQEQGFMFNEDEDYVSLTIATNFQSVNDECDWSFQLGDNSYSGACYHYGYWAVTEVCAEDKPLEVARDLIDQLEEHLAYVELMTQC